MNRLSQILIIVSSVMLGLTASSARNSAGDLPSLTVAEVQNKIQNDSTVVLLDVRTEGEFNGPLGHIEGARLIPVQELEQRIGELNEFRDKEIIVYCRSGNRSRPATELLNEKGFNAHNMLGGMKAWNKNK